MKDVIVNMALVDIGFMMGDLKHIEENKNKQWRVYLPTLKIIEERKPDSTSCCSKKAC